MVSIPIITTTTLVLGGSGSTGRKLVEQLLAKKQNVRAIVRSKERFSEMIPENDRLQVIEGTVLDMDESELKSAIDGCDSVVSCLGHTMTFSGVYGKPRRLVTDSLKKSCDAIHALKPAKSMKVILMGSVGVANPNGMDDVRPWFERFLIGCFRALVPPHADNEEAAAYLSKKIGKDDVHLEWSVVRPDELIDGGVSDYDTFEKPKPDLFGGGHQTTRANVAHFMTELILNSNIWKRWVHEMPVPLNKRQNE